jgi:NitT/TauT family transport system substrate-binding protein
MYGESQASGHFLRRRQVLRGAAAGLLSVGMGPLALAAEKSLQVGGLPVTCNLTLPVACMASAMDANLPKGSDPIFEFSKYSGWPEIKESLM